MSTPSVVLPGYPPGGLGTPWGGTWPGYPPEGGYLTWVPPRGVPDPVPPRGDLTRWYLTKRVPPQKDHAVTIVPSSQILSKYLIWENRSTWHGQTRVKTLPSSHPSDAGSKYCPNIWFEKTEQHLHFAITSHDTPMGLCKAPNGPETSVILKWQRSAPPVPEKFCLYGVEWIAWSPAHLSWHHIVGPGFESSLSSLTEKIVPYTGTLEKFTPCTSEVIEHARDGLNCISKYTPLTLCYKGEKEYCGIE